MKRLLCVLIFTACSEGVRQAEPIDCDPLSDEGCPAGAHCRVLAGGATACLDLADAGALCTPASCPPGEACAEVEGLLACRPLCHLEEGPCAGDAGVCGYGLAPERPWGLCPAACSPGTCPAGGTCAPTTATPYPICVATGEAERGQPCATRRCGEGLACLLREDQPRCARLCTAGAADGPCPDRCTGLIEGQMELRFCAD